MPALLAFTNPEDTGPVAGRVFVFICLVAGALKCWKISQKPTANRKCVLALMVLLLAFVSFAVIGLMPKSLFPSPGQRLIMGLLNMISVGLIMTAIILAILGLTENAKQPGVFAQGKLQAKWTLAISGLIILVGVSNYLRGLTRMETNEFSSYPATAVKTWGVVNLPGRVQEMTNYNFRFHLPDHPWIVLDASKVNKAAKMAMMRRKPDEFLLIIPEIVGESSIVSTEQLVEIAKAHMESAANSTRMISTLPYQVNHLNGQLVEREAMIGNYKGFYLQWFVVTNGFAYQLTGYGKLEDRSMIEADLKNMLTRFEQIDPHRIAPSIHKTFTTNFLSPAHGYSVEVANSAWHGFASLKKDYPEAEFGASQGDSCFVVLPVWLGTNQLSMEALTAGLLSTANIKYPDDNFIHQQVINEAGYPGFQCDYARDIDGTTIRYRIKIINTGEFGYMCIAWTTLKPEDADAILNDAVGRFKLPVFKTLSTSGPLLFSSQDKKNQGWVLNEAGLFSYRADAYEKALPLFSAAVVADNTEEKYVQNMLQTLSRLGRYKAGLEYLQTIPARQLAVPAMRADLAYFQSKCSLKQEALTNYAAIFSSDYHDEDNFRDYIELLSETHQFDLALQAIGKYLKNSDSVVVRLLTADIYREKHDYDKAVKFLTTEHNQTPYNSKITRTLIGALLDAGQPNEGLKYCKELLKDDPASFAAYYLKAQCELNLKWYREAKTSLEAAEKQEPSNESVRSSLNYVSALLGEGNNSMLREPIAPVPLPASVTNRTLANPPAEWARDYGAYISRMTKALSYQPHKEYKTTDYINIKVLSVAGVTAYSTYQMPFDPLSEEIYLNEGVVYGGAGNVLASVRASDCYVIDDVGDGKATHKKVLNLPIPGLQPGCKISLVVTRRSVGHLDEFPFLSHCFSKAFPVQTSSLYLEGDGTGLKKQATPEVHHEILKEGLLWWTTNPMVARWEPMQPPANTFLPMVWLADDGQQWSQLATNYLDRIKDQLQADEELQVKAKRLTETLKDNASKLAALGRFVQTNCTYKAIEFGRHANIPNKAADTLRKSYGDCKDHAVLLQQLLKAVGVPANLVLISSANKLQTNLPSLDQFNHMIVSAKVDGEERFYDCTDKGADLAANLQAGLAEYTALILDSVCPHLTVLPIYHDNASSINTEQHASLTNNTDLLVTEEMVLTGVHAVFLRNYLHAIPPTYRQMSLQRDMGMADVTILNLDIVSLESPEQPLKINCTFFLKNQFSHTLNGLTGILHGGFERYYLSLAPTTVRITPFEVAAPLQYHSHIDFDIPHGFHVTLKTNFEQTVNSRFISFQGNELQSRDRLTLDQKGRQPAGKYTAKDYASFQEVMQQVQSIISPEVVLQVNGK